ncbi:hypothetical protein ACHAXT_006031 [Thalassiosira profunda]
MAAVAPAPPSIGPSEPSSHRGSLATDLDDNSTLATEPSVPPSIRTSISHLSKNWSSNLAALDLHSARLPSQSGGASVASRASKSVKRGDVIRKMAPADANEARGIPDGMPALPAAIPAALVLAPERKLAPPKSKNPYAYADAYDVSPGSFQSSLETGALILPPALQLKNHLQLQHRAHGKGGDGEGGDGATEDSPTSVAEGSCVPSAGEGGAPIVRDARGDAAKASEGALVVHSHPHSDADDEWQVVPAPSTNTQLVPAHPALGAANPHLAEHPLIPGEHPLVREHRLSQLRGRDPAEIVRDRTLVPYDGPADPPGESPDLHPVVCGELVVRKGGDCEGSRCSSYSGRSGRNGGWRKIKWADPKSVKDEGAVDYAVLQRYEALAAAPPRGGSIARIRGGALIPSTTSRALVPVDPSSAAPPLSSPTAHSALDDPTLLWRNPRTRIATISSGYKKARFFVREDLDTRIYFHQLEDAVGYMAARGYRRMGKAEEAGWRELLGRAHGVVKKGAKKEKQRYRKGKLVLVLKKTVCDHDGDEDADARQKAASSRRTAERKVQKAIAGSQASGTMVTTGTTTDAPASDASQATGRTSLGKSVRGPYKSYSEKFLAEQEEDKRQYLLAVAEGRPLPQIGYGSAQGGAQGETLLLTDGSPTGTARGGDPEADLESNEASYPGAEASGNQRELHKSVSALSDRKGVYGGGVRYFTPDEEEDESVDESEDGSDDGTTEEDEDFAEEDEYAEDEYTEDEDEDEDETYTEGGTYDEEKTEYTQQSEEGTEASSDGTGSSLFSEEEGAAHDVTESGGVESADGSSRRRRKSPPRVEPIGDDDGSSTS